MHRDFTKSNREYLAKNKLILIAVALFLIVGIVIGAVFGMNGNFEISGYNEFSISITEAQRKDSATIAQTAGGVVNTYGGKYDNFIISGEGDNTEIIIRYTESIKASDIEKLNADVAKALKIDVEKIDEHVAVKPVVKATDYIYTAAAILIIVLAATLFAYFRHNGASALAILLGCAFATLSFMSIGAILRLSIGMSYFAILAILNVITIYFALNIFENMRASSWLANNEYSTALKESLKSIKFRACVFSVAVMLLGVLFVVCAPITLKYVALNVMFMAVVILAVSLFVVPFIWSVLITKCRKREYKVKASTVGKIEE